MKKILGWLIDSELIEEQEREIIEYGLEQGCCAIGGIIVAVVTGALLNMLWQSIVFIVTIVPLRMYAGGYHAGTRIKCTIISGVLMLAAFCEIKLWKLSKMQCLFITLFETIVLFLIIPVDGSLKLEEKERIQYQRKGRIILIAEFLICIGSIKKMHILIAKPITVVFGLVLLLDILAGIKKHSQNLITD